MALYVGRDPTLPEPDDVDLFDDMFGYTDLPDLCLESEEIGTHLVARADGKPLKAETVDAMADFCRFHLGPGRDVPAPLRAPPEGHERDHAREVEHLSCAVESRTD